MFEKLNFDIPSGLEPDPYVPPFDIEILAMTRPKEKGACICNFSCLFGNSIEVTGLRLMSGKDGVWLALPKQRPAIATGHWQKIISFGPEIERFLKELAIARWDALQMIHIAGFHSGHVTGKSK